MRKSRKYILIFMATIVLLLLCVLLLTQTSYFREKLKNKVISLVENQIDLKLEIEEINGNWYNTIGATNIVFSDRDSVVAGIGLLKVTYHLLPLTRKLIEIDSVLISEPHINLWQKKGNSWNWNAYVSRPKDAGEVSEKKGGFNFGINVKGIALRNGSAKVSSLTEFIPQKVEGLNLFASGLHNNSETRVMLEKLEFKTNSPSLTLKNLSGIYTANQQGIQIDSLLLITGNSNINSYANYISRENMNAKIDASRIDKNELAVFIPQLKLLCSPSLNASLNIESDSVFAQVELSNKNESVLAELSFDHFSNLFDKSVDIPYFSKITLANFNVANWIESDDNSSLVHGQLQINGTNLLDFNSPAAVHAQLTNSQYLDFIIDTLNLEALYTKDSIHADVTLNSQYGAAMVVANMTNFETSPAYSATIDCYNIDLNTLIPKLIRTKINGQIQAKGENFSKEEFFARAVLNLNNSTVYTFPLDSLKANLSVNSSNLIIDSLQLQVPGAFLTGSGNLSFDSLYLDTRVSADIESLKVIDSLVELPIKFDSVTTVTSIVGPVRFLQIGGDVAVFNAEGYSSKVERAEAKYLVEILEDSLNVHVYTKAQKVETGPAKWDSTTIDLNYAESKVDIIADLNWIDTLSVSVETSITTKDTMLVVVPRFEVDMLFSQFYIPDTMEASVFNDDKIAVKNLSLRDRNNESFVLEANGIIANEEDIDFKIRVNEFDLGRLNQFIGKQDSVKGLFETEILISGNPKNPSLNGNLQITEPQFGDYILSSLQSHFEYNNQEGTVDIKTPDMGESLYAGLSAKFDAYFDSLKFVFNPPETFNGNLILDSVDISEAIATFVPNDSIKGILDGRIDASGEWERPSLFGKINISDAQYINENLGVEYNNIKTSLAFDGNKITLDTVVVRQKNGLISVSGEVEFDSTIISGNIKSSSLQVDADRFFLTQHRNYEILIDANTFVKTNNQKPEFGGKIKVLRSDVYLPAFMPDNKTDIETDVPLLVQALQDPADTVNAVGVNDALVAKKERNNVFANELTGRLNVEIPRNTWVKSDDMRAELSGDLEIVKTGPYFEIFGNIDVTRGHYILYGRKLNIEESQIVFQGGEELDPMLNVKAEYIYRGSDKEKRYMELLVNGKMSEPDITFLLDGTEISETDGISILIFGVTSDEIGYGGQNGLINSVGSNAVASVITSQLSRTIGSQLKLDMIEITATDNWQSAAFVVGKYITNDIFVIYQRGFGEVDGDEITPETITIEYELNDKLFLRLMSGSSKESGVDVILKFEEDNRLRRTKNAKNQ